MVELLDLSIEYPLPRRSAIPALNKVNAFFSAGNISAILGPSGCGKTSLIHAIAGILKPTAGEVRIDGNLVYGIRKNTAIIFQDYGLLPWKTVEANAELPLRIRRIPKTVRHARVRHLLNEFGLDSSRTLYPRQLSGGMKQRLAIVRALVTESDLLLMDEPFSNLDELTREDAQDYLISVRKKHNLSMIIVTHSIEEAVYLSDQVFVMTGRNPGTITSQFDIQRNVEGSGPQGVPINSPASSFRETDRYYELCKTIRNHLISKGGRSVFA